MQKPPKPRPFADRANLFGGAGTVRVWNLLTRTAPPFTAVIRCALEPGGSIGAHRQQDDSEIVVGLGGSGRATVDGVGYELGEGDVVHVPHGGVLEIENRGEQELRYLIIKAAQSRESPP